jgi:hypothetical protein
MRCSGNLFTEQLPNDSLGIVGMFIRFPRKLFTEQSPSNGCCSVSHRLATGLYATVCINNTGLMVAPCLGTGIWEKKRKRIVTPLQWPSKAGHSFQNAEVSPWS